MILQLNGKQIDWNQNEGTVQDLLESYQLDQRIVVVERNKEIIEKRIMKRRVCVTAMS